MCRERPAALEKYISHPGVLLKEEFGKGSSVWYPELAVPLVRLLSTTQQNMYKRLLSGLFTDDKTHETDDIDPLPVAYKARIVEVFAKLPVVSLPDIHQLFLARTKSV